MNNLPKGNVFHHALSVFALMTVVLLFLITGCEDQSTGISFAEESDGALVYSNQKIVLTIQPSTRITVGYKKMSSAELTCIAPTADAAAATHSVTIDGRVIDDFRIVYETVQLQSIDEDFGPGKQLTFKALSHGADSGLVEKELKISLLDKYTDVAVVQAAYTNLNNDAPIILNAVSNNAFRLDRKQISPEEKSYAFWGFFGVGEIYPGSHGHRRVNVMAINKDLDIQNDSELISGVPLVDVWAPEMGLAIASLEPRARIIKMPAKVDAQGGLNISLLEEPDITIEPKTTYTALKTAIIVHSLDYYQPLQRYAQMMADQSITPKRCPDFGYAPLWCNWGYKRDWSLDHGLDRLDTFKALGIKTVTIDDGWFDHFGDWITSDTKFPEGEAQMVEWIDKLHAEDLNAILWWVPSIAGSLMVANHPEWIIHDKTGNQVRSHWKDAYMLCPAVPEVVQYHRDITRKFITEYSVDGFKMDGIYVAPRCYNPAHNHQSPADSYAAYEDVFKAIYETTMELRPKGDFVLGLCPCGAMASPYYLQWGNRPVTADPPLMTLSTRHRVRAYKALLGPTSCVDNDFHERYNDYFPVEVGCGGLVTTKFTTLSSYEYNEFKKWYDLYNIHGLSSGEYLATYDVGFQDHEIYAIRKGEDIFYTILKRGINGPEAVPWFEDKVDLRTEMLTVFDAGLDALPRWEGSIELRGLGEKAYQLSNLETGEQLGRVQGPHAALNISLKDRLLIHAVPD
ncbi:alpha-galactosidase [Candidatus Neomarinimicrobiota bacterium]